jgi:hypothetical protein
MQTHTIKRRSEMRRAMAYLIGFLALFAASPLRADELEERTDRKDRDREVPPTSWKKGRYESLWEGSPEPDDFKIISKAK